MEASRRSFLKGVLTLAAVAVAPRVMAIPRIVGDGIHDDTAGLQALFDGEPFMADPRLGVQWIKGPDSLALRGGTFRTTSILRLRGLQGFLIEGTRWKADHEDYVWELGHCTGGVITNNVFEMSKGLLFREMQTLELTAEDEMDLQACFPKGGV